MNEIINILNNNLTEILITIITGVISYLGVRIKTIYKEYIEDKIKKEIVLETVKYVEQTCKDKPCTDKKEKALEKAQEWINSKNIKISNAELEILTESAVNTLKKAKE